MDKSIQIRSREMRKTCIIKNCTRQSLSRGLCPPHYYRLMRTGNTDGQMINQAVICKTEGCENESTSLGLCRKCYKRQCRRLKGSKPRFNWKGCVCNICGKSLVRAKGLCNSCYCKHLRANSAKIRKQTYEAVQRQRFGGRRDDILKASGYICTSCGIDDKQSLKIYGQKLDIHHKDGNGRTSENPNNNLTNLNVFCKKCHTSLHRKQKIHSEDMHDIGFDVVDLP